MEDRVTYSDFMKQLDKVKFRMGKQIYKDLEAKFGEHKSRKTASAT